MKKPEKQPRALIINGPSAQHLLASWLQQSYDKTPNAFVPPLFHALDPANSEQRDCKPTPIEVIPLDQPKPDGEGVIKVTVLTGERGSARDSNDETTDNDGDKQGNSYAHRLGRVATIIYKPDAKDVIKGYFK